MILREKKDEGSSETQSRLLQAWQATEPTERPTVSLFVDFALSLLAHADAALLQRLLPIRWAQRGTSLKYLVFIRDHWNHLCLLA